MNEAFLQLITATIGTIGFAMIFHLRNRYLPFCGFGAFLGWAVYLLGIHYKNDIFLVTFIASFAIAVYAEILARVLKAPSTPFFITSLIPLFPGSCLYYSMNSVVEGDFRTAGMYGMKTLLYAIGIAAGMSLAWALCDFIRKMKKMLKHKEKS